MTDAVQALTQFVYYLVLHLATAVLAVIQPGSYLYWPFLLGTLCFALLAVLYVRRRTPPEQRESGRQTLARYLGAGHWWHRSARADYRLYLANALLLPLLTAPLIFSDAQFMTWLNALLGREMATLPAGSGWAHAARIALYSLLFFIVYDFGRFLAHALLHRVPLLWEFHKVHHTAQVLTPFTAFRLHPVDLLVMLWVPALATGLMTWLFNLLSPSPVSVYMFLGWHVLLWGFNLVDNLRHSNVWLSYGPRLGKWLISPAHHQLHHSALPQHMGCNLGFELAMWDRLYGSLYVPSTLPEPYELGIGDGSEPRWQRVWYMYWTPFVGCWRVLRLAGKPVTKDTADTAS